MKTFILGVVSLVTWSGCTCGPTDTGVDLGASCALLSADAGRAMRQADEYASPVRAVDCVDGACIANALPDGGTDQPYMGYCSRRCTNNSECVATTLTSSAGECRVANAPDAGSERYCWYQ